MVLQEQRALLTRVVCHKLRRDFQVRRHSAASGLVAPQFWLPRMLQRVGWISRMSPM